MEKTDDAKARRPLAARYKEYDVALERLFTKARDQGYSIPCKKGCSWCCYEAVLITHFEAPPLVEALRLMDEETRKGIKKRLLDWFAQVKEARIPLQGEPSRMDYYRAGIACPALDPETKTCLVYEARPIACRAHHIVNALPDVCMNVANDPRVPSLELLHEQLSIPYLRKMAEHSVKGRMLMLTMGMLPMLLWAVWPLVEDPSLSITAWLERANREGLKVKLPAIYGSGTG